MTRRVYRATGSARPALALENPADWKVFPVAGSAYRGLDSIESNRTHAYNPKTEKVLCRKVKPSSILEDYELESSAEGPTCPVCRARLAKMKGSS